LVAVVVEEINPLVVQVVLVAVVQVAVSLVVRELPIKVLAVAQGLKSATLVLVVVEEAQARSVWPLVVLSVVLVVLV